MTLSNRILAVCVLVAAQPAVSETLERSQNETEAMAKMQNAQLLTEEDMGGVALSSGRDILNVMGASAASGEVMYDTDAPSEDNQGMAPTIEHALSTAIDAEQSLAAQEYNSQDTAASNNPVASTDVTPLEIKEFGGNGFADVMIQYEKANHTTDSNVVGNSLSINQSVQVNQIQILNLRDGSGAIRGNYSYNDINVSGSVLITPR